MKDTKLTTQSSFAPPNGSILLVIVVNRFFPDELDGLGRP
jgi:hypothetical protein